MVTWVGNVRGYERFKPQNTSRLPQYNLQPTEMWPATLQPEGGAPSAPTGGAPATDAPATDAPGQPARRVRSALVAPKRLPSTQPPRPAVVANLPLVDRYSYADLLAMQPRVPHDDFLQFDKMQKGQVITLVLCVHFAGLCTHPFSIIRLSSSMCCAPNYAGRSAPFVSRWWT